MKAAMGTLRRTVKKVGAMTFLAWTFIIGVGGFFLMCGLAYAIVTENLPLGLACGALLIAPIVLGAVWVLTMGADMVAKSLEQEEAFRAAASETNEHELLLAPGNSMPRD